MLEQVPILRLRAESLSESTCEAIEKGHCRNLESIHLTHLREEEEVQVGTPATWLASLVAWHASQCTSVTCCARTMYSWGAMHVQGVPLPPAGTSPAVHWTCSAHRRYSCVCLWLKREGAFDVPCPAQIFYLQQARMRADLDCPRGHDLGILGNVRTVHFVVCRSGVNAFTSGRQSMKCTDPGSLGLRQPPTICRCPE